MKNVKIDFDNRRILSPVKKGVIKALRRAGAYVRKAAINSIKYGDKPSKAGMPPHSSTGALKRAIFFGVEKERDAVLIGPGFSHFGATGGAHEFGGVFRKRRYPKRPFMWPALQKNTHLLPSLWQDSVK